MLIRRHRRKKSKHPSTYQNSHVVGSLNLVFDYEMIHQNNNIGVGYLTAKFCVLVHRLKIHVQLLSDVLLFLCFMTAASTKALINGVVGFVFARLTGGNFMWKSPLRHHHPSVSLYTNYTLTSLLCFSFCSI